MTAPLASTSRHTLDDDPSRGTRAITRADFRIESTKLPILTIPESDEASNELDLALPEIIFGNNKLSIKHEPTGLELNWNTRDMLRGVKKGQGWEDQPGSGALRVAHADEWTRGQSSTDSTSHMTIVKPFDWTYTTLHPGTTVSPESTALTWEPAPPTHPGIPLALLARTDIPILFFDEVPLFEDELGDNGIADVTIRVRVNASSFYVLARYALRIDHVLFRHFDVRVYHQFGSTEIVRELKGRQSTYEQVKARLAPVPPSLGTRTPVAASARTVPDSQYPNISIPSRTPFAVPSPRSITPTRTRLADAAPGPATTSPEDLTKLTDANWVAGILEQIALEEEMTAYDPMNRRDASTAAPQEEDRGDWGGKGKRLEILRVPWA
ncbi:Tip41p [Sporobolomyces koalae]|uniref:Tip41p n=1 Tax=Sporobolomyces koalae TaxID=500713 RepID=UPI00316BADB3